MPITIQCENEQFSLSEEEVAALWAAVRAERNFPDDTITVRCVSADEIRRLKREYLARNEVTNVLTFSYDGEHDVALCLSVAAQEAQERHTVLPHYVALLLTHALLHATGMAHESAAERAAMQAMEQRVLAAAGFPAQSLFSEEF